MKIALDLTSVSETLAEIKGMLNALESAWISLPPLIRKRIRITIVLDDNSSMTWERKSPVNRGNG